MTEINTACNFRDQHLYTEKEKVKPAVLILFYHFSFLAGHITSSQELIST